jgi:hypothetical protein
MRLAAKVLLPGTGCVPFKLIPYVSLFLCLYLISFICLGLQFGLAHIVSAQLQILTCLICIKILILKPGFVSNAREKLG